MTSLSPAQLAALRKEYAERALRRSDLAPEPISQFQKWLGEAIVAQLLEPNAMALTTVDEHGQPWSRVVLLKVCDARGFVFFTNYEGSKGRHLAREPRVALTFWWDALERQVNVTGLVEKISREESDAYFRVRPLGSRLGAWASQQSSVLRDRAQLEQQLEAVCARFPGEEIPTPPNWGGYVVRPETVEFWQGRRDRLHDRLRFTRAAEDQWRIERLSP